MSKLYGTPTVISHFRKIVKAHRNGRTPQEMLDLHNHRAANRPAAPKPSLIRWIATRGAKNVAAPSNVRAIPLGSHSPEGIEACTDRRKKNYRSPTASILRSRIDSHDLGRYSSRCTYTHHEYTQRIESWGAVVGQQLYYRIDTASGIVSATVKSPRGYSWSIDKNGIRLVSNSDARRDYHPTASDLLTGVDLRAGAKNNLRIRQEQTALAHKEKQDQKRAMELIRQAEREGATVCLVDSMRAGNCRGGTENWARNHGLDPRGHYTPSQLSAIANGDAAKVAIVVATAIRRHRFEMARGFAELSDHRIS